MYRCDPSHSVAGEVPRRSLTLVSVLSFLALFAVVASGLGTEPLVLLTTGSFVAVYAVGVAAAVKLLPEGTKGRAAALGACVAVAALLVMAGRYLLWPLAIAGAALLYLRVNRRRGAARLPDAVTGPATAGAVSAPPLEPVFDVRESGS